MGSPKQAGQFVILLGGQCHFSRSPSFFQPLKKGNGIKQDPEVFHGRYRARLLSRSCVCQGQKPDPDIFPARSPPPSQRLFLFIVLGPRTRRFWKVSVIAKDCWKHQTRAQRVLSDPERIGRTTVMRLGGRLSVHWRMAPPLAGSTSWTRVFSSWRRSGGRDWDVLNSGC